MLLGPLFCRLGWQQGRRGASQRADLRAVILIRDLPGPVVEFQLLQLGEDAITLLGRGEGRVRGSRRHRGILVAQEGDGDEHDRSNGQDRPEQQFRAHALTSDSPVP